MPFVVQKDSLPLNPGPKPEADINLDIIATLPDPPIALAGAPALLPEWVERQRTLAALDQDWANPGCKVVGLVGFGGQGKTSIARHWIDRLLRSIGMSQPKGIFWWGFYEARSVDEFFEAVLRYLTGGQVDPHSLPSTHAKVNFIATMLPLHPYLFVLDGIEVLQHQDGDEYGFLINDDLAEFLQYFSATPHDSFCVVTSRTPLYDLIHYVTYSHQDVNPLQEADGQQLLRNLGVWGEEEQLNRMVNQWDGHALTLSLLAAYLVRQHKGDVSKMPSDLTPIASESSYDRVSRLLKRYDEQMNPQRREFLEAFSAFRLPVSERAIESVFGEIVTPDTGTIVWGIVSRLVESRILRFKPQTSSYTIHPLIRSHYLQRLSRDRDRCRAVHAHIADYYETIGQSLPENPTLEDLEPLIEAVHHLCSAAQYDRAFAIMHDRIYEPNQRIISHQLGAYETALALLLEFFPQEDATRLPQTSDSYASRFILNGIGFCLMSLGRLREAPSFFERHIALTLDQHLWDNASIGYQNLATLFTYLGDLKAAADAANQAYALAHQDNTAEAEKDAIVLQAWVAHLQGNLDSATRAFEQAQEQERQLHSRPLYGQNGIRYADHLSRLGKIEPSRQVTIANLEDWVQTQRWRRDESLCDRILGDLAAQEQSDTAGPHYTEALKLARTISDRAVLIQALAARGRWLAKTLKDSTAARSDLDEALSYAVSGGFRLYEADIRVGLAWAYLAADDRAAARQEATLAHQMSQEMGYYWGRVDAEAVINPIENSLDSR